MTYTICTRTRRLASPPEGMRQEWEEVRVVEGRKIVHRCGTVEDAENWIKRRQGDK